MVQLPNLVPLLLIIIKQILPKKTITTFLPHFLYTESKEIISSQSKIELSLRNSTRKIHTSRGMSFVCTSGGLTGYTKYGSQIKSPAIFLIYILPSYTFIPIHSISVFNIKFHVFIPFLYFLSFWVWRRAAVKLFYFILTSYNSWRWSMDCRFLQLLFLMVMWCAQDVERMEAFSCSQLFCFFFNTS